MHLAALLVGLIACVAIIVLGVRFILQPRQATLDFGIARRQPPRPHRDQGSSRHHLRDGAARGLGVRRWHDARLGACRRGDHTDRGRTDRPNKRREALKGIGCPRAHSGTARCCGPRSRAGMKDPADDRTHCRRDSTSPTTCSLNQEGTNEQPGNQNHAAPAAHGPTRQPAIARSDDEALVHLAVVGDTYTVLLSGEQTTAASRCSTCSFRRVAGLRRTVTTSRNASGCWPAR